MPLGRIRMKPMPVKWEIVIVDLPKTDYEDIKKELTLLVIDEFNKRIELVMEVDFADKQHTNIDLSMLKEWKNKYLRYVEQLNIEKELTK